MARGLGLLFAFVGPPARSNLPCVIGLTRPGFFLGAGLDTLLAGSPVHTDTVLLLYTSSFLTVSSFLNVMCAFLSFFLENSSVAEMTTLMAPLVRCSRCVTSSVLKWQWKTGSASSALVTLSTTQSSRRLDSPTAEMAPRLMRRSHVVCTCLLIICVTST